ncbi:lysis protein [Pseudomonas fluorescens]|uniref:lysis system i-spanin subunit Rz n=1 Tax=Pseudomonas fluorescens TaxID=294 RepID=UPI001905EC00|nr:lysis system i-spanin subunit Rz [Pseudomonas fluorescens]MBD8091744.1 lysis protein [Pseudomonas fluorescens]MBD8716133.1 lysis protein [Pseudomonas fluorescens]
MTPVQMLASLLVMAAIGFGVGWKVQDWRYGQQLEERDGLHQADLSAISNAASAQQQNEKEKRLALEHALTTKDQTLYRAMSDAQHNQSRLRDRLATAELRLSVIIDADTANCSNVPTTAGTAGVVHATRRAQLDSAHAQRIIGITNDGDQGLIALKACQAYVSTISLQHRQ